jgi:hypothetical protein
MTLRDLTVEEDLSKLVSNVALARNFAGVQWRSNAALAHLFRNRRDSCAAH